MKKASRPRREQPNMDLTETQPHTAAPADDFSLEDIINEFGGWSKREPAPEQPVQAPIAAPEPVREVPAPAESKSEDSAETKSEDSAETKSENPVASKSEDSPESPADLEAMLADNGPPPAPPAARPMETQSLNSPPHVPKPRRAAPPRRRPPTQAAPRPRPAPVRSARKAPLIEFPAVEVAYKNTCKATRGISVRQKLMGLWCLLAIAATFFNSLQLDALAFLNPGKSAAAILLGLLLVSVLTCYDVLVRGVYHCLKLTFGLDSLLVMATVVFTIDGFYTINDGKIPYTAVLCVGLFFALWAEGLQNKAKRRALKTVLGMDSNPSAAVMARKAVLGRDCVFRSTGTREGFVAALESPDGASSAMRVYAPAILTLSLVLALVLHFLKDVDFLGSWSAMLAGSIPAAAFVVYWRPFASLSGSLQRSGAALCGWQGAKHLSGRAFVAVEDADLFAAAGVSMNGMKVFGNYNVSQVVGYTYAVIAASGCGLEPTFREVFANQNGRSFLIDNFKRYEGGGVGAEIQGEVILVGSIGFMQLMGVKMPEGTNVRQAVYCAVNTSLAAVFAIHYNPSSAVKSGLQTILAQKGLSLLLATRDFILTPAFIRHKYKIPTGSMDYPAVDERVRLSEPQKQFDAEPSVLFSRDSFLALAEAIAGGRSLCHSVRIGVGVSLFGGILGFMITLLLSFLGSFGVASALNLMAFTLLWTLPVLLLTAIAGK